MNDNEIMVSVCCITYNHEKYIRQALDGFVMQKTNFKYEVIIHDDASTDGTTNIIKEYEKKYPEIIKPIYQKENQYTKIKQGIVLNALKKAKGKYVALCEGDDYWIDENKLQEQVEYLENNKNCTLCFHNAFILDMNTSKTVDWNLHNKKFIKKDNNYNAGEIDLLGFIPTASYMFRAELIKNIPSWFNDCVIGDRVIKLIMTSFGYGHYIDKKMSIYRVGTGNSAMDNINKKNKDWNKAIIYWKQIKNIIEQFDKFSNFKYKNELDISKNEIEKNILFAEGNYKEMLLNKKYNIHLTKKEKIKLFFRVNFPKMYEMLKKGMNS